MSCRTSAWWPLFPGLAPRRRCRADRRPQLRAGCRRSAPHSPAQERWRRRGAAATSSSVSATCLRRSPTSATRRVPPERAAQSCSGAMAARWLRRQRVRSVRPACAGRRPQLHAGCRRGAPNSPAQERWRRRGLRRLRVGQCGLPAPIADCSYPQVAAGTRHSVLLRGDGGAAAAAPTSSVSATCPRPSQGAAGARHAVLLRRDGGAVGCGGYELGQCDLPAAITDLSYTQVAAGGAPHCPAQERGRRRDVRRQRVRSVRPACADRQPQLHAGCRRGAPPSPA